MKNIFIELTGTDDEKFVFNVMHIAWIVPNKNGTTINSDLQYIGVPRKVKESYQEVRSLIASLDS
ncbi:MAG: hypothetical protein NTZ85_15900 [Bacteroidia bacterium]|jgi:hypothetical protein|nr:hypothetical protein [Bacteroidia bacterium]